MYSQERGLHTLAGVWQMIVGIGRRSHLLGQKGSKTRAIGLIDSDILTPVGDMVTRLVGHSTSETRHQPGIAMATLVFVWDGSVVEGIVMLDGMLQVVATSQGLDAQDIVQVEALVAGNGCSRKKQQQRNLLSFHLCAPCLCHLSSSVSIRSRTYLMAC